MRKADWFILYAFVFFLPICYAQSQNQNLEDSPIQVLRNDKEGIQEKNYPNFKESHSLKMLLQNALRNPLLQSKERQIQALREEKNAVYAEYLPKVVAGYAYQDTQNPDIFYPKKVEGAFVEAQWLIFDGLAREGKLDIAHYKLKSKEHESKGTKEQLQLRIIQEYFNALSMQSRLNALTHQQEELKESILKYQKFYDVGLASRDTLEAIKAQSYQNIYATESAKTALKAHLEQLSLLSGLEVNTLNERTSLQEVSLNIPSKEREDLQANFYTLKAQESVQSQYTYLPIISLSNRYTRYNYSDRTLPHLPFEIPIEDPAYQNTLGLSIRFTLFDSLATYRAKESARLQALAANFEYTYLKDSQRRELIIAKENLRSAKEKIQWADSSYQSASIAYSYAKEKFNSQLIDYTQYLNALSTLLNAQSFYDISRYEYEVKKAEFLYQSGESLELFVKD